MAGTPTQYYSLPTYADSDAVDLTAQYNQAVATIDSTMHSMDVELKDKPTVLILGDSWTVAPYGPQINNMFKKLGYIVENYGVGGATISGPATGNTLTAQVNKAVSELEKVDLVLIIAMVNDMSTGKSPTDITSALNPCLAALNSSFGCKIIWLPNIAIAEKSTSNPLYAIPQYLSNPEKYGCIVNTNLIRYMLFNYQAFSDTENVHPNPDLDFGLIVLSCLMGSVHGQAIDSTPSGLRMVCVGDQVLIVASATTSIDLTNNANKRQLFATIVFGSAYSKYQVGDITVDYTRRTTLTVTGNLSGNVCLIPIA